MTKYEIEYSKFLADISQQVADFVKNGYFFENVNKNSAYNEQPQEDTDLQNSYENVDNDKVELIDYYNIQDTQPKLNKTIFYIIGAIIIYNLLRGNNG